VFSGEVGMGLHSSQGGEGCFGVDSGGVWLGCRTLVESRVMGGVLLLLVCALW
jgi:hypothetical protein